jgi:hypothetical protein
MPIIKSILLTISLLFSVLSYSQHNDTIYTYITNFSIKNPLEFTNKKLSIIENNVIIISSQRFSSTFIKRTKNKCFNSYKVIDVENEDEAIDHRTKNKRNNILIALADNYMQGYIRRTTDYYEISTVVKNFDGTFNTFTVYEKLKFSDDNDSEAINICFDNLSTKISNILCPDCNSGNKSGIVSQQELDLMKQLLSNINDYDNLKTKKKARLSENINIILNNPQNYQIISVSINTLVGLWWLEVKENRKEACTSFTKALKNYCTEINSADYNFMYNNITTNSDIELWLKDMLNKCN